MLETVADHVGQPPEEFHSRTPWKRQNALCYGMRAIITKDLGFSFSSEFIHCLLYIDSNGMDVNPGHSVFMER